MKIKTAGPATILPGGKVKCAQEAKIEFKINFETVRARHSPWPIRARPLPSKIRIMQSNTSDRLATSRSGNGRFSVFWNRSSNYCNKLSHARAAKIFHTVGIPISLRTLRDD